jgi:chlorite dismutase
MQDSLAPLTLEGHYLLHQMFRLRQAEWRRLPEERRHALEQEACALLERMAHLSDGASCAVAVLGQKADLMLMHFRPTLEGLHEAQQAIARLGLSEYLEPAGSYVSVVELGLYEMTLKIYSELEGKGLQPDTPEFGTALAEEMSRQRERMKGRLTGAVPKRRYVCFYPMNKKRGEIKNWYAEPVRRRGELMREHGMIGRRYGEQVTQIISGSIGYDDWEWGVDLFADDPLVFKKLVYEMRFDEASSWYGEFGPFVVGLQFSPSELPRLLSGHTPAFRSS